MADDRPTTAQAFEQLAYDLPLLAGPDGELLVTAPLLPLKGINYNRNHLRKMWNEGKFPRPVKLSPRKLAWKESELNGWLASPEESRAVIDETGPDTSSRDGSRKD